MRPLFVLVHLIFRLAIAEDTQEEVSSVIPCPFASRLDFSREWPEVPHDFAFYERTRSTHGLSRSEDLPKFLVGRHLDAIEEAVTKEQYGYSADESTLESRRALNRNKGSESRPRSETRNERDKPSDLSRQANTNRRHKTTQKKRKKTKKRGNKNSKLGKRGGGLTTSKSTRCFSSSTYDSIDSDIAKLKQLIKDDVMRSHFLGGIVRLAAHDFMDFDKRDRSNPMGSDGCFDETHPTNKGLPESVWCKNCLLRRLYEERYSFLSRADFWIASANAVIRQTSERGALDLRNTFKWGRKDRSTCRHSASRLPEAKGCRDVEKAFLTRMGLDWRDAVALMGAHSLGRGSAEFSGHEGTWVDTARDAQRFDKQYYEEIVFNAWRPRNVGLDSQDFTTGNNNRNDRMMLNTDICLVFNIDNNFACCTKTDEVFQNGQSKCIDSRLKQCPLYSKGDSRWAATEAVVEYIGGTKGSANNAPFYSAFATAWEKATTNGWNDLKELTDDCDSS